MSWVKRTLGEIYDEEKGSVQTGPFGSQLHESDYKETGNPIIMPKDIINDKLETQNIARINEQDTLRLSRHIVKKDDIVFPRRGDIGKRVLITEKEEGFLCGTGCLRLRGTGEIISPQFLFLYLKQPKIVKWIENQAIGATMPNLNTSILRSVPVKYPPLPTQQKIATILSAYDDLIENNNARIKLLGEMAEEIYKEWFVRLRFPNYENVKVVDGVPEGWEKEKIGNLLEPVKRKPKVKKDEYLQEGKFPIIDQGEGIIAGYTNDKEYVQEQPLPLLVFGDHTRRVKFIDYPFAAGADGTQLLSPKNKKLLPIYFFLAVNRVDLSNFHYSRHFKFLKQEYITIPDDSTLEKYNEITAPFYKEIEVLRAKNKTLQQTRDLLLPRLISGKLSVEDINIEEKVSLDLAAEPKATYGK